jgi:hypothetical protein
MTYPNMDLQSLPTDIDLRVGTDQAERALQLAYWQVWAGIRALAIIKDLGIRPEQVVNAGDESAFDSALTSLIGELNTSMVYFDTIWAMVP